MWLDAMTKVDLQNEGDEKNICGQVVPSTKS